MSILRKSLLLFMFGLSSPVMAVGVGETAPSLSAPSSDGRILSLDQFRGKVVYVDFWASWCVPCQQAMPVLDALYQRYRGQDFVVLGINVDAERKSAQRMLDQLHPAFPVVFDPAGKWPEAFGLRDMPTSYLIDSKGVVRYVQKGYRERDGQKVESAIKAVLGDKS